MEVAQQTLANAIAQAPPAVSIGMAVFNDCSGVQDLGTFDDARRQELTSLVAQQSPRNGTPLAQAILTGLGKVQGGRTVDDPANILLVSDGMDSCGGDPCAAAALVRQQRPGVAINIVDLGASDDLRCVADTTGGFYKQAGRADLAELERTMREAAGYEGQGVCR